jgi:hypothetical protein
MARTLEAFEPLGKACLKFSNGDDIVLDGNSLHGAAPYLDMDSGLNIDQSKMQIKGFSAGQYGARSPKPSDRMGQMVVFLTKKN